ncbi:MAG: nuclear transport factor 2 family protein, partial [Acidimicrobiia bacterium]
MITTSPELVAVMRRLLEAVQNRDAATVRSMVPPEDHLLIVGSAAEEWTHGSNAVGLLLTQIEGLADYRYEFESIEAFQSGTVGWA